MARIQEHARYSVQVVPQDAELSDRIRISRTTFPLIGSIRRCADAAMLG